MIYEYCILLKVSCELFSAGKWQQYMQWMPKFFCLLQIASLLLSDGWFSSTHILLLWVGQSLPEVCVTLQCVTLPQTLFFPIIFFCWWGSQGCGPALARHEWNLRVYYSTSQLYHFHQGLAERHCCKVGWGPTVARLRIVLDSIQFCWPRVPRGEGGCRSSWNTCYWFLAVVAPKAWKAVMLAKGKRSHHSHCQALQV